MRAEGVFGAYPRVRAALPQGRALPEAVWAKRHRAIVGLLWLHAAGLALVAGVAGVPLLHTVVEIGIVAAAALLGRLVR
jgi:hypothetical protein